MPVAWSTRPSHRTSSARRWRLPPTSSRRLRSEQTEGSSTSQTSRPTHSDSSWPSSRPRRPSGSPAGTWPRKWPRSVAGADPMLTQTTTVRFEKRATVAWVTLDRQGVLNAMNEQMHIELARVWDEVEADDEIRVVVITGAGDRAFSVGMDLK